MCALPETGIYKMEDSVELRKDSTEQTVGKFESVPERITSEGGQASPSGNSPTEGTRGQGSSTCHLDVGDTGRTSGPQVIIPPGSVEVETVEVDSGGGVTVSGVSHRQPPDGGTTDNEATTRGTEASSVDNEARTGDDEARNGDTEARTADSEATRDIEARTADNKATTGDNEATTGDNEARTGDNEATTGDNEARTGDNEATTGDNETTTGDNEARTGDTCTAIDKSIKEPVDGHVDGGSADHVSENNEAPCDKSKELPVTVSMAGGSDSVDVDTGKCDRISQIDTPGPSSPVRADAPSSSPVGGQTPGRSPSTGDMKIKDSENITSPQGQSCIAGDNAEVTSHQDQSCIAADNAEVTSHQDQSCIAGDNTEVTSPQDQSCIAGDNTEVTSPQDQSCIAGDSTEVTSPQDQSCIAGDNTEVTLPQDQSCIAGDNTEVTSPQDQSCIAGDNTGVTLPQDQSCIAGEVIAPVSQSDTSSSTPPADHSHHSEGAMVLLGVTGSRKDASGQDGDSTGDCSTGETREVSVPLTDHKSPADEQSDSGNIVACQAGRDELETTPDDVSMSTPTVSEPTVGADQGSVAQHTEAESTGLQHPASLPVSPGDTGVGNITHLTAQDHYSPKSKENNNSVPESYTPEETSKEGQNCDTEHHTMTTEVSDSGGSTGESGGTKESPDSGQEVSAVATSVPPATSPVDPYSLVLDDVLGSIRGLTIRPSKGGKKSVQRPQDSTSGSPAENIDTSNKVDNLGAEAADAGDQRREPSTAVPVVLEEMGDGARDEDVGKSMDGGVASSVSPGKETQSQEVEDKARQTDAGQPGSHPGPQKNLLVGAPSTATTAPTAGPGHAHPEDATLTQGAHPKESTTCGVISQTDNAEDSELGGSAPGDKPESVKGTLDSPMPPPPLGTTSDQRTSPEPEKVKVVLLSKSSEEMAKEGDTTGSGSKESMTHVDTSPTSVGEAGTDQTTKEKHGNLLRPKVTVEITPPTSVVQKGSDTSKAGVSQSTGASQSTGGESMAPPRTGVVMRRNRMSVEPTPRPLSRVSQEGFTHSSYIFSNFKRNQFPVKHNISTDLCQQYLR